MGKWQGHREAVRQALKRKGKSVYWLHQQLEDVMTRPFLYSYLKGKSGIGEEKMEAINQVLGIRFTDE
jgi:hypothetical protein